MKYLMLAMAALTSCSGEERDPILAATSCVERQVPDGTKVTASVARRVMANCDAHMEAWSRATVEGAYAKPLDRTDPDMMEQYDLHREVSTERMLLSITDEIDPSFVAL